MNNLQRRLFDFAVKVLKYLRKIPNDRVLMVIRNQLVRACTSPGAVYEEAQGAVSRPDFHNKICICLKEVRESNYWLRMIEELNGKNDQLTDLIVESEELMKIVGAIGAKTLNKQC